MDLAMPSLLSGDRVRALTSIAKPNESSARVKSQRSATTSDETAGQKRLRLQERQRADRVKAAANFRERLDSTRGLLPPVEREQHCHGIVVVEEVLVAAITRPRYCDESRQVEQVVVVPAVTQRVTRVVSPVVSMHKSGRIDDDDLRATERWYRDWAMVEANCRSLSDAGSGRDPSGLPEAVLFAATELRAADAAVGKMGARILREMIGQGMSVKAIADLHSHQRVDDTSETDASRVVPEREMAGVCGFVVKRLAEHYEARHKLERALVKPAQRKLNIEPG